MHWAVWGGCLWIQDQTMMMYFAWKNLCHHMKMSYWVKCLLQRFVFPTPSLFPQTAYIHSGLRKTLEMCYVKSDCKQVSHILTQINGTETKTTLSVSPSPEPLISALQITHCPTVERPFLFLLSSRLLYKVLSAHRWHPSRLVIKKVGSGRKARLRAVNVNSIPRTLTQITAWQGFFFLLCFTDVRETFYMSEVWRTWLHLGRCLVGGHGRPWPSLVGR